MNYKSLTTEDLSKERDRVYSEYRRIMGKRGGRYSRRREYEESLVTKLRQIDGELFRRKAISFPVEKKDCPSTDTNQAMLYALPNRI